MADGRTHEHTDLVPSSENEDGSIVGQLERSEPFPGVSSLHAGPVGLSRRGWGLLIAAFGVAAIALLILAGLAIGNPARSARADTALAPPTALSQDAPAPPLPNGRPTPSPTPKDVATVPAQPVSTLTTGDCLQTYSSPWESGYPVVDCTDPHIAQLISTGTLTQPPDAPFPGSKALDDQVTGLCSAPDLLDWNWVAIWNEDVYVDVRYPNTDALWASGARAYYCFVYTFSRHELTGSAVPSS